MLAGEMNERELEMEQPLSTREQHLAGRQTPPLGLALFLQGRKREKGGWDAAQM